MWTAGCQLLCGHCPFSCYFPEILRKAVKRWQPLPHDIMLPGDSCQAASAPQVHRSAFPGVTFSFAQTVGSSCSGTQGHTLNRDRQGSKGMDFCRGLHSLKALGANVSPQGATTATSRYEQLWDWRLCPNLVMICTTAGFQRRWGLQCFGQQRNVGYKFASTKRRRADALTLGWSCCTASTAKQILIPDFVTIERTLFRRVLATVPSALLSGSSPSASPGISTSGTWCNHSSWASWFQPQNSFCCKEQRKTPEFVFWMHCTRMIRELAGPQGWHTSLSPPPRLPSDTVILVPKAVAEATTAGELWHICPHRYPTHPLSC